MADRMGMIMSADGQEISQDTETQAKIAQIIKYWSFARHERYNFETQWQEVALLLRPEWANTFFYGYDQWPGQKKTQQQIDSTGMLAVGRFEAIVDSLLTPYTEVWHRLGPDGPDAKQLMKSRRVKRYYEQLNNRLWCARYSTYSNFQSQNNQNYGMLALFGNMHMYVDELDTRFTGGARGLRYRSISPGEIYLTQNHQGMVDGYFRAFRWTARQIYQAWPNTFPAVLRSALENNTTLKYWVLEYVYPRVDDFLPWRVDNKAMQYGSMYISIEGHVLLEEKGYHSFPLPTGRYSQAPDEVNGRGPAQKVLPTLKTLNAMKGVFLKQGHRAGDPIYLTFDDTINFKSHPGAWNPGMLTKDGKPLVQILETGNIQITTEQMVEERDIIKDEFLVKLFQMSWESKDRSQMSARQVVEFIHDRGILIAPTVGRQHSEYLGPLIHRELSILARLGELPDLPPELREAGAGYQVEYHDPLSRSLRSSKTSAFMRMVEMTGQIVQATQEPALFDKLDFDAALPDMAENEGVPETWITSPEKLAAKTKARQDAQDKEDQIKAMPAQAAIIKAQAVQAKAQTGGNIGGTLSGTPASGMPQVPGNPQGTPGQPGVGNNQPGVPGQPPVQGGAP
jgi:Bacteriophage head to tail connecting protein